MDVVDAELRLGSPSEERTKAERVRIIACGAIAREVLAIRQANGLDHIDLVCLPAIWHAHPQKIAPGVEQAIAEARAEGFSRIFVGYADCGTGGLLDKVCEREGVERIAGPHCYSFFVGNDAFAAKDDDVTSFFLTDFLARQLRKARLPLAGRGRDLAAEGEGSRRLSRPHLRIPLHRLRRPDGRIAEGTLTPRTNQSLALPEKSAIPVTAS